MAIVRLTKGLREEIKKKALEGMQQQLQRLDARVAFLIDPMRAYHEVALTPAQYEHAKALPAEFWAQSHKQLEVKWVVAGNHVTYRCRLHFPQGMPLTTSLTYNIVVLKRLKYDNALAIDDAVMAYMNWEKNMELFTTQIKTFLDTATTLQQVSQLWPTVLDYVADDVRALYNAPVKIKTKRKITLSEELKLNLAKSAIMKT